MGELTRAVAAVGEPSSPDDPRVVVIRGAGRAFSSGHDLKEVDEDETAEETRARLERLQGLTREMGYPYRQDIEDDGDRRHAVVTVTANYMAPVTSPGPLVVVLQFEHCGKSSLRMVWQALRPDGLMAAEGSRTVVHVDGTNRAEPWSEAFRERLNQVLT